MNKRELRKLHKYMSKNMLALGISELEGLHSHIMAMACRVCAAGIEPATMEGMAKAASEIYRNLGKDFGPITDEQLFSRVNNGRIIMGMPNLRYGDDDDYSESGR